MSDDIPRPELVEFHVDQTGVDFTIRHPIVPEMARQLAEAFRDGGGINYVSFEIMTDDLGALVLLIQRKLGYHPSALAARYSEALMAIAGGTVDPADIARQALAVFGDTGS